MASRIIGDQKFQELNMSFSFDEQHQGKLKIQALVQNVPYEIEVAANPYLDFEDVKNMLLCKQFKLISKSPEILKLKVGATGLEFKNAEKQTLNSVKQTMTQLKEKLKDQDKKNMMLQETIKRIRIQLDLMSNNMAQMGEKNDDLSNEIIEFRRQFSDLSKKNEQQTVRGNFLEKKIEKCEKEMNSLRQQLAESRTKIQSYEEKIRKQQQKLKDQTIIIKKQRLQIQSLQIRELIKKQESKTQKNLQQKCIYGKIQQKYHFSQKQKSNKITLINGLSQVNLSSKNESNVYCLALVAGAVLKKGSSIRFKVQLQKGCVTVGLGISNLIASNSYQLKSGVNTQKVGHGCFVNMWNGRLYSHSRKDDNDQIKGLKYDSGDVIKVTTNVEELIFINQTKNNSLVGTLFARTMILMNSTNNNQEYRMKINLTEDEWKQACFCVSLNKEKDSVSIL